MISGKDRCGEKLARTFSPVTTIYRWCGESLKAIDHRGDRQINLSGAEVMSVPLVTVTFFGANIDKPRLLLGGGPRG